MINEVIADAEDRMLKAEESLRADLRTIRTGRASPALVERINVDYYSMPTPLQQLAAISVPEAQTLVIRPYSPADIASIEKAIAKSDLGLTPNNDGQQIRLTIPALTEERRRELTKTVNRRSEEARVAVRNIRRDANNTLKDLLKSKDISEDDERRAQDDIQKLTDRYIGEVDKAFADKEKDLMAV